MLLRKRQRYQGQISNRKLSISASTDRSHNRLPSLGINKTIDHDRSPKKQKNYDKYYIHPTLRYRLKDENPKANPENYQDQTFIYKNLHNENFWNWVHPLESLKMKKEDNHISKKVNLSQLEKFRIHVQSQVDKRVPILVNQLLQEEEI